MIPGRRDAGAIDVPGGLVQNGPGGIFEPEVAPHVADQSHLAAVRTPVRGGNPLGDRARRSSGERRPGQHSGECESGKASRLFQAERQLTGARDAV